MDFNDFLTGIQLMPQAIKVINNSNITEEEYQQNRKLFQKNREEFFRVINNKADFREQFLYYYTHMACETYTYYKNNHISEEIYFATFQDITLWCKDCKERYGVYGIDEYQWLFRHIEAKIFRLGSLQFERALADCFIRYKGEQINPGDEVIHIHIPNGANLTKEAVEDSFKQAIEFFGSNNLFVCHSWLLYPDLTKLLNEDSNILRFQTYFDLYRIDYSERQAEERIFKAIREDISLYPERTSLQRKAKQYLLAGKRLGLGFGIYKLNR
ncbi:hypothetical protein SAMN05421767_10746 [Granulicatella balaenopterae]|uniref:GNAT-like C-terminal domain-containing protein n=1 Tax=Granulicatella balaenopterae TaxID=137733 RepID=A0A1H9J0X2_9LACT|nr:acyltransferase domain-containing protein [Granulicatella balaenopterae]SEQ80446.1 hypothetical protein SAMN05421767_10746 [Granulicatella balaenopterae]